LIERRRPDVPSTAWLAAGLSAIRSGALPAWLSSTTVVIGAAALAIRAFPEETYGAEDVGRVLFLFVPLWFAVAGRRPLAARRGWRAVDKEGRPCGTTALLRMMAMPQDPR